MNRKWAVVVLAAGASTRLGKPKQLLPYLGETLVEHAARTALGSGALEVLVVVGAESDAVRSQLAGLAVRMADNPEWREGMGSSIRHGVAALGREVEFVVIALCDQPRITASLLNALAERHFESNSAIVASSYGGVKGAPCGFGRALFPQLLSLKGDSGARELIRNSIEPIEAIEFSEGNLDVDTSADYETLLSQTANGHNGTGISGV